MAQAPPRIAVLEIGSPLEHTQYQATTTELRAHLKLVKRYHKDISDWKALSGYHNFAKFTVQIPADMNTADIKSTNPKIRAEKTAEMIQINRGLARLRQAFSTRGNQVTISAGMISQLTKEFNKFVNDTTKIVSAMRKRVRKTSKQRAGFSIPQQYNDEIVAFFRSAMANNLIPTCGSNAPMDKLAENFFANGIASQNMMRNMLMVYAYNAAQPQLVRYATTNGGTRATDGTPIAATDAVRSNKDLNRGFLGVDLFMLQNLQAALQTAINKFGQVKSGARPVDVDATGALVYRRKDIHGRFDPNNFKLGSLQSIGAAVKVPKSTDPSQNLPIMTAVEKAAYREHVLKPERIIKDANDSRKKAAKTSKAAYNPDIIPYMVGNGLHPVSYKSAIEAKMGVLQEGSAVLLQLRVDEEDQNLTVFRNCLKNQAAGFQVV